MALPLSPNDFRSLTEAICNPKIPDVLIARPLALLVLVVGDHSEILLSREVEELEATREAVLMHRLTSEPLTDFVGKLQKLLPYETVECPAFALDR